jgi:uncharacterized protein
MTDSAVNNRGRNWFRFACLFELGLVLTGVGLAKLLRAPGLSAIRWTVRDVLWATAATIPLLLMLVALTRSRFKPIREITDFLHSLVRPALQNWSLIQLAALSALAGLGEELVFRGVLQTTFATWVGFWGSLALTNLLFGACHWITFAYALLATIIGIYFGLLLAFSGNLLVPAFTHALYDFIALVYFV